MPHDPYKLIADIRLSIDEIERFCADKQYDDFEADLLLQRAIEREMEIIGEALNRLIRIDEEKLEETIPELVKAREREVVVVCRSGHRSLLSAKSLEILGFENVASLKGGIKGWNDFDLPLLDTADKPVDPDEADEDLTAKVREDQLDPARRR